MHITFVGKAEGKISIGRSRHRWEDDVGMDLKGVECEQVERIGASGELLRGGGNVLTRRISLSFSTSFTC